MRSVGLRFCVDSSEPVKFEELANGSILLKISAARSGVQEYAPWLGCAVTDRMVRVYRPPEEVFAVDSIRSFAHTPLTRGHPPERCVSPENWQKYAVGHITDAPTTRETFPGDVNEYVGVQAVVSDGSTIAAIKSGELYEASQGYFTIFEHSPGVTNDGTPYDYVQRKIVQNHTALLGRGFARAGKNARIYNDSTGAPMKKTDFEKLVTSQTSDAKLVRVVQDSIADSYKLLDDDAVSALVDVSLATAKKLANDADEEMSEEKKKKEEEEKKKKEEEKAAKKAADEEMSEEEKKKKEEEATKTATDQKDGETVARQILDAQQELVQLIDTRSEVVALMPSDYKAEGKRVKQLLLDAIEYANKDVYQSVKDASLDTIKGSFNVLKLSKSSWIKKEKATDSAGAARKSYVKDYQDRMNAAWE